MNVVSRNKVLTHSFCKRTLLLREEVKIPSCLAVGIILRKSVLLKEHHGGHRFLRKDLVRIVMLYLSAETEVKNCILNEM